MRVNRSEVAGSGTLERVGEEEGRVPAPRCVASRASGQRSRSSERRRARLAAARSPAGRGRFRALRGRAASAARAGPVGRAAASAGLPTARAPARSRGSAPRGSGSAQLGCTADALAPDERRLGSTRSSGPVPLPAGRVTCRSRPERHARSRPRVAPAASRAGSPRRAAAIAVATVDRARVCTRARASHAARLVPIGFRAKPVALAQRRAARRRGARAPCAADVRATRDPGARSPMASGGGARPGRWSRRGASEGRNQGEGRHQQAVAAGGERARELVGEKLHGHLD